MKRNMLIVTLSILLAGCAGLTETPYSRPQTPLPATWEARHAGGAIAPLQDTWWDAFDDKDLSQLMARVMRQNADLALAGISLKTARLQAGLVSTNMTPDVSSALSAGSTKDLSSGAPSKRLYGSSLSLAWEIDFWGRLSHARDAAAWNAIATRYDLESTRLALANTTATSYWNIAYLNTQLADTQDDLKAAQRVELLAEQRYRAGSTGLSDLSVARQNRAGIEARYEQLRRQREGERRVLAILLNDDLPAAVVAGYSLERGCVPDIPVDTPTRVLARRPDVAAAEARIRSYLSSYDAARASMYPTFSLTGSLTTSGDDRGHTFSTPVGTLGPTLTLPFLQWNTVKLNTDISRAQYDASVVVFRQTLYQALAEVGNVLMARDSLVKEAQDLRESLKEAEKAEAISASRYRAGAENIRFWLDDQRQRRAAQSAVIGNRRDQLQAQMALYQAIGGGAAATK